MNKLEKYQKTIVKILSQYAKLPYAHGNLERRFIISQDQNNYLLLTLGWQSEQRVHFCLVHLEIFNDKIWIHQDGIEDGIANDLVAEGISKSDIVLGFHPPEIRQYTEYAVN